MNIRQFCCASWFCSLFMLLLGGCSQADPRSIAVEQARELLRENEQNSSFVIVDVRTPEEFAGGHIKGATLINYYDADFGDRIAALPADKTYFFYCRSGNRTSRTMQIARNAGLQNIFELKGGTSAWAKAGLPLLQ